MNQLIRSLLFVPANRADRFDKALNAGADLICIDLEDAVLPQDKASARQAAVDYINAGNHRICVRINPVDTELGQQDLAALATTEISTVMLAKCGGLADIERASGVITSPACQFIGLIETIDGLEQAKAIASHSRVAGLMFGGADMSAELRCQFAYEPLLFARSQLVIAAASANKALIDVPYIDIKNTDGLALETEKVKALGFTAKAAIHPCQIATIHNSFSPSEEQIAYAEQVLAAVDSPDAGVVVVNGKMIDRPIILAAERTIELAGVAKNQSTN